MNNTNWYDAKTWPRILVFTLGIIIGIIPTAFIAYYAGKKSGNKPTMESILPDNTKKPKNGNRYESDDVSLYSRVVK